MKRLPVAIVLGLVTGCLQPAQTRYERELDASQAAGVHAVHDRRLQQLMRSLSRLSDDRLPKAMDVEIERNRRAQEVADVARSMATSAQAISDAAPPELQEDERAAFLELAQVLEEQALELSSRAADLTAAEMRSFGDRIAGTCDACHVRFRFAGPLGEPAR